MNRTSQAVIFWKQVVLFLLMAQSTISHSQTVKILFDATKAQMSANADWVIDADLNNLGYNAAGNMLTGLGSEANPQGIPTPAQIGITATTPETFWTGGLSAWAVDCVKKGYKVESLPYNDSLTYGNTAHAKDLKNYTVLVICEPNILFTASQKNAIVNFVKNGGGLFIIADHDSSDRNNDGFDSPYIWNNLFTTNTVKTNPFGVTFALQNFSQTSTNVANLPGDTCLHGPMGNVTKVQFSGGTTMTLNTTDNPTVKGLVYKTGSSSTGTTNVLFARAYYGDGKICAIGDSSPSDDGTGDVNDVLYNGYTGDANGQHQLLLMNATIWLATNHLQATSVQEASSTPSSFELFPNPSGGFFTVRFTSKTTGTAALNITDMYGRTVVAKSIAINENVAFEEAIYLAGKGVYVVSLTTSEGRVVKSMAIK